jgi:hypothetical protein
LLVTEKMPLQVVRDFPLQVLARLSPLFKKVVQLFQLDEQVGRGTNFGLGTRERAYRVD